MNRPRDQILAGAALAGDQDGEIVALQPLDLIGDPLHRGARADESRNQRLEWPFDRAGGGLERAVASGTELEPLAQDRADRPEPLERSAGETAADRETDAKRGALPSRPIGSTMISGVGRPRSARRLRRSARAVSRSHPA